MHGCGNYLIYILKRWYIEFLEIWTGHAVTRFAENLDKDTIIVPADELQEPAARRAGERASGRAGGRAGKRAGRRVQMQAAPCFLAML